MLEQGVDRIVAQVVDPKVNHIFRPQVERVVREFLSPGSCSEEPPAPPPAVEPKPENSTVEQGTGAHCKCTCKVNIHIFTLLLTHTLTVNTESTVFSVICSSFLKFVSDKINSIIKKKGKFTGCTCTSR